MTAFKALRVIACLLLASLVASKTSYATNTVTITSPSGGGPYAPPASVDIAGGVGYDWFFDTNPYGVTVWIVGPKAVYYVDGFAYRFTASYGSGTWNYGTFAFGNGYGWPSGYYDIIVFSTDYYGNQLSATVIRELTYTGSDGGGGLPPMGG